jgi:hypothetical protein
MRSKSARGQRWPESARDLTSPFLIFRKDLSGPQWHPGSMATILFRCPNTNQNVQAWLADEPPQEGDLFLPVQCLACRQVHHVNPETGRVLGTPEEE